MLSTPLTPSFPGLQLDRDILEAQQQNRDTWTSVDASENALEVVQDRHVSETRVSMEREQKALKRLLLAIVMEAKMDWSKDPDLAALLL